MYITRAAIIGVSPNNKSPYSIFQISFFLWNNSQFVHYFQYGRMKSINIFQYNKNHFCVILYSTLMFLANSEIRNPIEDSCRPESDDVSIISLRVKGHEI